MPEKLAEVYEQYDLDIVSTRKGRGATILSTSEGIRILEPFRGNQTRLEQEYVLKQLFQQQGWENLDILYLNRDEMLITCDRYRQPYVLKRYFEGSECDMKNPQDIARGIQLLARLHISGWEVARLFPKAWKLYQKEKEKKRIEEIVQAMEAGVDLERLSYLYDIPLDSFEHLSESLAKPEEEEVSDGVEQVMEQDIQKTFDRHNKQLQKIRRFILRVKRKNSFENLFLQVFGDFYTQGLECVKLLSENKDRYGTDAIKNHWGICHGSYNQHNVILNPQGEAVVHFEHFSRGNQLNDLYQFARKVMEKNHYDRALLNCMLMEYNKIIPLTRADYGYMYVLFSYPEKFWKIANSYYNTNKAFLSPKYVEKLEAVIVQEEEKKQLLQQFEKEYGI